MKHRSTIVQPYLSLQVHIMVPSIYYMYSGTVYSI